MITIGLPVFESPIAWLAMESLCAQVTDEEFEIIVLEDGNKPLGEKFFTSYMERFIYCSEIKYVNSPIRISLSEKWFMMKNLINEDSAGLLLQAADCYSEPNRLQSTAELLDQGFDWVHSKQGYFYNIDTRQIMLFNGKGCRTGLNMAISKRVLDILPKEVLWKNIDNWIFTNAKAKLKDFKTVWNDSLTWDKGVDTDGRNKISMLRRNQYVNPKDPFEKTAVKIKAVLPDRIIAMF